MAKAAGVVGPVIVATGEGHLCLTFSVVARVTHVLGIVFLVKMWADELEWLSHLSIDRIIVLEYGLLLVVANCISGQILNV